MFRLLNNIIRDNFIKRSLRSCQGQVAIILILVIAGMLIFYAVTLNFGKASQAKALTTIASNVSAGQLGSAMASYAQNLSMTQLKGKKKLCMGTGLFGFIFAFIIAIIATIFSGQGWQLIIALVGLVLSVVSLVLQVLVVQPGITSAWNRIISKTLTLRNQITEGAIQAALLKAVEDGVNVPDVTDLDNDRVWVPDPGAPGAIPYADTVNRFTIYYGERLQRAKAGDTSFVEDFARALREFLLLQVPRDAAKQRPFIPCLVI